MIEDSSLTLLVLYLLRDAKPSNLGLREIILY